MTAGDREAFQQLVEPYRRELRLHCYRMLGSYADAEDLVQETFIRAWRGFDGFEGRASVRTWLYRIATNACLNVLASRRSARRVLRGTEGPPSEAMPDGEPDSEIAWLEPYPDSELEGVADAAPGPDARYEMGESVRLAFVAAIQHLPPRQRAALLLHDVLRWSSAETAGLLDATVASVNSALQRARATLERRFPDGRPGSAPAPDERQRALLDRYVRSWEDGDLDGFVSLLREDAVLTMPPWPQWYLGRRSIGAFFVWVRRRFDGLGPPPFTLVATAANRQPAFAVYVPGPDARERVAHTIQVLTLRDPPREVRTPPQRFHGDPGEGAIASIVAFRDAGLFAAFGLPAALPPHARAADVGRTPAGPARRRE